jgi:Flp pilus assembly protein CpaB
MAQMTLAHRLVSTKKGSLGLAALAAVIAGALILVYVNRYRESVRANGAQVTVLVAKRAIAQGTPGRLVASQALFTVATIRESQLRDGAFSDPASLVGRAASRDIYSGQQLTAADFAGTATSLASKLTGAQRIVAIPLDASHGLTSDLNAGDHVDVYAGFNITPVGPSGIPVAGGQSRPALRLVMQNITVAGIKRSSGGVTGGSSTTVGMKVNDQQAAELAFASDNGKVWLALRPIAGAKPSRPAIVTAETMLLGIKPIAVERALGGRR